MKSASEKVDEIQRLGIVRAGLLDQMADVDQQMADLFSTPTRKGFYTKSPAAVIGVVIPNTKKTEKRFKKMAKRATSVTAEKCNECHTTGSRHFKWCTKQKGEKKLPDMQSKPEEHMVSLQEKRALSSEEYDEVRSSMKDKEFMSGSYALSHKLSPREVNKAVRSANYQEYLDDIS